MSYHVGEAGEDGWSKAVFFFDDQINLHGYYGGNSGIVTYAFTYFYSPADTDAELWLGRQEPMYIYLNSELVYSETSNEDFFGRKEGIISLNEGENTLLVKTLNNFGDYTFALNICEVETDGWYEGNRIFGLKFYTDTLPTDTLPEPTKIRPSLNTNETLLANIPNPFTDFTTIKFTLPKLDIAKINVYDLNGKLIENLATNYYSAGTHEIKWEAGNLKPGNYICTMKAGRYSESIKL